MFSEEDTRERGKLYKPQSRLSSVQETSSSAEKAQAYARLLAGDKKPERLGKRKQQVKSNLESFKEELRQYGNKYGGFGRNLVIWCFVSEFKRRERKDISIKGL